MQDKLKNPVNTALIILSLVIVLVVEFIARPSTLLDQFAESTDLVMLVIKIASSLAIIALIVLSLFDKRNELSDLANIFVIIYFAFCLYHTSLNPPDTWAKIQLLLAFPLTYLIKTAMLFKSKKIQTGGVEFIQFIAITLLTIGLIAYLWISRF